RDFVISNEKNKGFPNFINLIGIESPGLTCCLSIAEYVEKIIE
ncbi:MAG: NAD(P)/FAD-dependent oxidoreductase, partial [Candidatus Cloacimonetes bacterium]|nr:NAD(P)/FAD-dependent oxidoreductase [Candidatus Cloacimonadota bacterium]